MQPAGARLRRDLARARLAGRAPRFACKRLPPFPSRAASTPTATPSTTTSTRSAAAGVRVVETELAGVERADGSVVGYVVQPVLPPEPWPRRSCAARTRAGHPLVEAVVATAAAAPSGPRLGLDASSPTGPGSGRALTYIDVTTPLIWSAPRPARGSTSTCSLRAYPAVLRRPLRRFLAPRILDAYRDLRGVYPRPGGNLIKERLDVRGCPRSWPRGAPSRGAARRRGRAALLPLRRPPLGGAARSAARPRLAAADQAHPCDLLPGRVRALITAPFTETRSCS